MSSRKLLLRVRCRRSVSISSRDSHSSILESLLHFEDLLLHHLELRHALLQVTPFRLPLGRELRAGEDCEELVDVETDTAGWDMSGYCQV